MATRQSMYAAIAVVMALGVMNATAQTVTVNGNGNLQASTINTPVSIITNVLILNPGTNGTGFNFSGATGSFSSAVSTNGYYYADYLINITGSTAQSVATSLSDPTLGGVANLSERIYSYDSTVGTYGFLGDAAVPTGALQKWSTNYPLPGVNVSIIGPTGLTAGNYVVELRGTTAGNYGGTLSLTPVPELETYAMLLAGLGLMGFIATRRKNQGTNTAFAYM